MVLLLNDSAGWDLPTPEKEKTSRYMIIKKVNAKSHISYFSRMRQWLVCIWRNQDDDLKSLQCAKPAIRRSNQA